MNKTRKLLSLITSAALATSAFSAFVFTASAEDTTVETALLHTADSAWSSAAASVKGLDAATEYFNGDSDTGWAGCAYMQFDLSNISSNDSIRSAYLTFDATSAKGYTSDLYYLTDDTTNLSALSYSNDDRFASARTKIDTIASVSGGRTVTEDVKSAVKEKADNTSITFMLTANAGSGTITGKGAETGAPKLVVTTTDAAIYTVTVNCVDSENPDTIIATSNHDVLDGETFTPTYENTINYEGYKYTYASGADEITVTDNTTVTLDYSKRALNDTVITLNGNYGNDVTSAIVSKTVQEDSDYTIGYPKYAIKGGKLYTVASAAMTSGVYYAAKGTATTDNQTLTVPYTADAANNAVMFAEAEDLAGQTSNVGNSDIRCSNGACYTLAEGGMNIAKLAAGTYTLEAVVWGTKDNTFTFKAGDTAVHTLTTTGSAILGTSEAFTVENDTILSVDDSTSNSSGLDYVLLRSADGSATPLGAAYAQFSIEAPEEATTAIAVKATYNDDNTLASIETENVDIAAGQDSVKVYATEGTKVMLWNSLAEQKALADAQLAGYSQPIAPPTEAPTEEATATPSATEAPTATPEPTKAPITNKVFLSEDFTYDDQTIIRSAGNDVDAAPDPVVLGSLTYEAGRRNNGSINDSMSISSNALAVSSDNYSSNGRGTKLTFADTLEIPAAADLGSNQLLELSMDVTAPNQLNITGFGVISNDMIGSTSQVHLRAIIDTANNKQSVITTDGSGAIIASTVSNLTATGFTGISFQDGISGYYTIDNLVVETKESNVGYADITVLDNGVALDDVTLTLNGLTFTSDTNGKAVIALPNGDYTVTASKSGYEHTQGMQDSDSKSFTIASNIEAVNMTLSLMSYIKVPDTVTIEDGTVFIAAPKTAEPSKTAPFTVKVLDQYGIEMTSSEYTTAWSIFPAGTSEADANVTIDENGIVSVAQGFNAANNVAAYDVTVVAATDDRNQKVTKTLIIGNNDITYYEPISWAVNNGTRSATQNLAETADISKLSSVTLNLAMNTTEGNSNIVINSDAGKLVGLQLASTGTLTAWTNWTGNSAMNQSGDLGNFANGVVLLDSYTGGTVIDVTFVIDPSSKTITVSTGSSTVSLPYTIAATKISSLQMGQYRNYGGVSVNNITVQEPDNNYLAISGDSDFAKVSGQTLTRTYALGQSVIVPDETFDWSVTEAEGISIDQNGLLSVADTAAAGKYTITATSAVNAEKTATFDVTIGGFEAFTAANLEISGPQAYQLGSDTEGIYTITKAVDSFGDDVTALLPTATWSSSNTDVATIAADGTLSIKAAGTTTVTAAIDNGGVVSTIDVPVTVGTYFIIADATGNQTAVDCSAMITSSAITGYLVTTATADGTKVSQNTVSALPTTVDTTGAAKLEITPVFNYSLGNPGTLNALGEGYNIPIPAATYNFTVSDTGVRCDVYANKQMLVNNILQGSSAVNTLDVKDILINDGVAKISVTDYSGSVNVGIKVSKAPSIVNRTKKVYVIGDSLACIYYNGASDTNNTYQTGWGQVLNNFVKDVDVVDLANSGATANGLRGTAMTQVIESSQPGDILLLESGYNDRTYDTQAIMTEAVTEMIAKAKNLGVDVVCVTPNASQHDYKAGVAWSSVLVSIAETNETPCIRLDELSYNFLYGLYADDTTTVKATYNVSDGLHSQYRGAQKWASMVATELKTLGFGDIINTDYTYTFTDTLGNEITCKAE